MDIGLLDIIWDNKLNNTIYKANKALVYVDQLTVNPMLSYTAVMAPVGHSCVLTFTLLQKTKYTDS